MDPATTEIYTLSLHDALPISDHLALQLGDHGRRRPGGREHAVPAEHVEARQPRLGHRRELGREDRAFGRSEEHTSELQSLRHLVCRLLLEKKKKKTTNN